MFFTHALNGFFFMMIDEPIEWNDNTDKEAALDYAFEHQHITQVNPALAQQYKTEEKNLIGLTPAQVFRDNIQTGRAIWMELFNSGKFHVDANMQQMDGGQIVIEGYYICIYDEQNRITGIFGVQNDITEQRKVQNDLVQAKEAAEAANIAKSQFLANMSHEIRTPLNAIIGFTELLKDSSLNPVQRQYAENAHISGHSLLNIVSDILDFSKIEANMLELDPVYSDIIELIHASADIVKYAAAKKDIELLVNIDQAMPRHALVDPVRLKQILANLLNNAVKFTAKGEVELKVDSKAGSKSTECSLNFQIRDTGVGISAEQQSHLFQAFSQADNSISRKYGGTGLGLVIAGRLAKKMGSRIEIESQPGKGSIFSFSLQTKSKKIPRRRKPKIPQNLRRCLIIEKNKNYGVILANMLASQEIDSVICASMAAAKETLTYNREFDLILCDCKLHKISNKKATAAVRKILAAKPLPLILMYAAGENIELEIQQNENRFLFLLEKPVHPDRLFSCMENISPKAKSVTESNPATESIFVPEALEYEPLILVAEDSRMNMVMVKSLIRRYIPSARIHEATNGQQALELYRKEKPDVILMDVQMPEMDGLTATKHIRKEEANSSIHTPIIAVTAGAIQEERERGIAAGMDTYITKPIDFELLQETLKKHLSPKSTQ
jgi:signal transduction histidine kinase/CheY-like chemotaxis protein